VDDSAEEVVDAGAARGGGVRTEYRNVQRFRGGLAFKAHRLVYHSTLGLRVIKKKETRRARLRVVSSTVFWVRGRRCISSGRRDQRVV